MLCMTLCVFFFFKQKTAYEMRISDWSSDVCSSDLALRRRPVVDRVDHGGVGRVDRLDQGEPAGMRRADLDGVARVVAIHGVRRDQQRTVHADRKSVV